MKRLLILLIFVPVLTFADPLYSPTWGFFIDLPEGYEYTDGDGRDRFSFSGPEGLMFDLVVYYGRYNTIMELVNDVNRRLSNRGDADLFLYNGKQAAIMKLTFGNFDGWGFTVELDAVNSVRPMLLALAYGPSSRNDLDLFHLSALDSISPTTAELRFPGPVMEYSYPRGELRNVPLAVSGLNAMIRENDAEAAQVLIEREFRILQAYVNTPYLQDACIRYYRFIYRDSYDRIANAVTAIVRNFGLPSAPSDNQKREFAQKTLSFVQGFKYERDLTESDFINLVTAVTEGRGDCDSRAVLFAIILANADIRSAIMISFHFAHAMVLADVAGTGARFEAYGTQWLVGETTAVINIGLIAQEQSDPRHWFAVLFE
jgi:hypothetical protein